VTAWILFVLVAFGTLVSAVMVVRTADLVRAVLWLAASLVATAGLYALLDAGFLAAMQLLLYTGGIITLMLFAVMLVRRGPEAPTAGLIANPGRALTASLAVFGLVAFTVAEAGLPTEPGAGGSPSAKLLGQVLLGPLALPFEALSVLLLAAMVGAIALARRKDPEE